MSSWTQLEAAYSAAMPWILAYFFSPILYGLWLYYEFEIGALAAYGDSIGILIISFLVQWSCGALSIIFAAFAATICRR